MRLLSLTTLYPNAAAPAHGVFVENRLAAFAERHHIDIKVVAPVPWFPIGASWAGRYGAFARAPERESRRGFEVFHPRYLIPPKIGMTYAATALEQCFEKAARALIASGFDFDLIDAHYLYPDGVAAARVAAKLGKPVVITARGSDVSLIPAFPRQRRMILDAIYKADAIVSVADALKHELVQIGAPREKVHTLRNGVDLDLFRPLDRNSIRNELELSGPVLASVGHLIERKGHHLVIEALKGLPGATLLIVGEGEDRGALEKFAARSGVAGRVRFLGPVAHEKLAEIYNAADALVLASSREGWPNVLLEAMASGTPVVATPVHGSVDIVRTPEAGRLAKDQSAPAIADAVRSLLAAPPPREAVRLYAEKFSWDETSDGLAALFNDILAERRLTKSVRTTPIRLPKSRPKLIVTVDTEEIFDWSCFDRPLARIAPADDIDRFQMLAASAGAKPLYFLTLPMIDDRQTAAYFRGLFESGAADLGLHLHQWATPPQGGYDGEYYSWQCNLPLGVRRQKLAALAGRFEKAFCFRARAHRAGRYGISPRDYAALAEIGVDLDFSPSPGFDFSRDGGPDFSGMRSDPFIVGAAQHRVAVTPVSAAAALRGSRLFLAAPRGEAGFAPLRRPWRQLIAPARLTCEGASLADLAALTKRLIADGTPVLTFSLHSTSMTPGGNPYARDQAAVDAMVETSRLYFEFFAREIGGEFIDLDELAALYGIEAAPAPACGMVNPALITEG